MKIGCLLSMSLLWATGLGAAQGQTESYALSQCAMIQLGDSPRLYLACQDKGLEAVEISTKRVLWHTNKADFPLMAREDRLLVLLPVLPGKYGWRLAVLDARSGKILSQLPPWGNGMGTVGEGMGTSTGLEGLTKEGRDYVVWRSTSSDISPINHPYRPVRMTSGVAEVDLLKGNLVPVSGEFPDSKPKFHANLKGGERTEPFEVEGVTATVSREFSDGKWRLVLRRKRGLEKLSDVELCQSHSEFCGVAVSADLKTALGVDGTLGGSDKYETFLYSTVTGEKLGHLMAPQWPSVSVICKDKLVYYFPDQVTMMDLSTGRKLFSQPLRDLRYHGSYPPAARP